MAIHWIIDIVLVAIVAYCGWRGWRNGIIVGVCGCVALIVSIVAGNIVASVYGEDFSGMLEPFAAGVVDSAVSEVVNGVPDENGAFVDVIDPAKKTDPYAVSFTALQRLGLADGAADGLAQLSTAYVEGVGQQMSENLSTELCRRISFLTIFSIVFILVLIVFTVVGNVIDLRFTLPGIELVDHIAGAVLGVVRGAVLVVFIAMLLRYAGIFLAEGTIQQTAVAEWLMNDYFLAGILGV